MTEAEQAAIDLIDAQQQGLVAINDALTESKREAAALKEELATFQQTDALAAIAERRDWFETFRNSFLSPTAPPASDPATEQA